MNKEYNIGLDKPKKIEFKDKYYYIDNQKYNISNLRKVRYGHSDIDNKECYIRLYSDIEINNLLHYIPYQVLDINIFIETMEKLCIPVLPTILESYPEFVKAFSLTHSFDSSIYERGLISFWKERDDIYCFFKPLGEGIYKKINTLDDINLKSFLENPRNNLKEYDDSYGEVLHNVKFRLILIDNISTLNRGYGLYPISNEEIILKDILYSFSEEEIKTKIIELFKKYLSQTQ